MLANYAIVYYSKWHLVRAEELTLNFISLRAYTKHFISPYIKCWEGDYCYCHAVTLTLSM